ncbi:MAG TPA: DUF488 family protein [Micromonosporaceae bacterium]
MPSLTVKRVYEEPGADGQRVLVDRIWPRGLTKQAARVDLWLKEVAPSRQLREWYSHDPARYDEFRRRYLSELDQAEPAAALRRLRELTRRGPVTLLTATREPRLSQAAVLRDVLSRSGERDHAEQ